MSTIYEILSDIQKKLKAPKNQINKFGGYKYRSCEDILESVKPLLPEGVVITVTDDIILVGNRFYVKACAQLTMKWTDINSDDVKLNSIQVFGWARESESKKGFDESQITGAASSYARKYALSGLFALDDTKDADFTNQNNSNQVTNIPFKKLDDIELILPSGTPAIYPLYIKSQELFDDLIDLNEEDFKNFIDNNKGKVSSIVKIMERDNKELGQRLRTKVKEFV